MALLDKYYGRSTAAKARAMLKHRCAAKKHEYILCILMCVRYNTLLSCIKSIIDVQVRCVELNNK